MYKPFHVGDTTKMDRYKTKPRVDGRGGGDWRELSNLASNTPRYDAPVNPGTNSFRGVEETIRRDITGYQASRNAPRSQKMKDIQTKPTSETPRSRFAVTYVGPNASRDTVGVPATHSTTRVPIDGKTTINPMTLVGKSGTKGRKGRYSWINPLDDNANVSRR